MAVPMAARPESPYAHLPIAKLAHARADAAGQREVDHIDAALFRRFRKLVVHVSYAKNLATNDVDTLAADVHVLFLAKVDLDFAEAQIGMFAKRLTKRRLSSWHASHRRAADQLIEDDKVAGAGSSSVEVVARARALRGILPFIVSDDTLDLIIEHELGTGYGELARTRGEKVGTLRARVHRGKKLISAYASAELDGCLAHLDELGPEADVLRMVVREHLTIEQIEARTGLSKKVIRSRFCGTMHKLALIAATDEGGQ